MTAGPAQWLENAGTVAQARHTMEHGAVPARAQRPGDRIQAMSTPGSCATATRCTAPVGLQGCACVEALKDQGRGAR